MEMKEAGEPRPASKPYKDNTMKFPMIVYKEEGSDYCGLLPDFPGMFLAEKTLDDLAASVQDAVEAWMEGEDPEAFPAPSSLEQAAAREDAQGRALVMAEVDPAFMDGRVERISITVPRYALAMIDRAARKAGKPRSTYLVERALASTTA